MNTSASLRAVKDCRGHLRWTIKYNFATDATDPPDGGEIKEYKFATDGTD